MRFSFFSLFIRFVVYGYRSFPLSAAVKQRIKIYLFSHMGYLFKTLPAYQNWCKLHPRIEEETTITETVITAPTLDDFLALKPPSHGIATIDVIMPIYRGYAESLNALFHLLSSTNHISYEAIVINDATDDSNLALMLEAIRDLGLITLITHRENQGFVLSANYGMSLHPDRDVVLLNADTEVYKNWLDRIRQTVYHNKKVATATPLSNNAEILSYPQFCKENVSKDPNDYKEWDKNAAHLFEKQSVAIPTGVGFCMYITRSALLEIGCFDNIRFGRGYGEENDFCMRASQHGYSNICVPSVFVRHIGGVSFATEKQQRIAKAGKVIDKLYPSYHEDIQKFIAEDPLKPFRRKLDASRLKSHNAKEAIVFISHQLGGGIERHIQDLMQQLQSESIATYLIKPVDKNQFVLMSMNGKIYPNLLFTYNEASQLTDILSYLAITHIHIHSMIGFDTSFTTLLLQLKAQLSLTYYYTIHDYFTICPRVHLVDKQGIYCGEPDASDCNKCLAVNGASTTKVADINIWRNDQLHFLSSMDQLIAPTHDCQKRILQYFPKLQINVKPHPESYPSIVKLHPNQNQIRTVIVIGAINLHKGETLLIDCIKDAAKRNLPLQFHIIGYLYDTTKLRSLNNVTITGPYKEEEALPLITKANGDLAFFPALWPETFSYTLSLALAAQLFPVGFEIGAIAERLNYLNTGYLLSPTMIASPDRINDTLLSIEIPQQIIQEDPTSYPSILNNYYG